MADALEPFKGLLHRVRGAVSRHRSTEISGLRVVHDPQNAEIDIVAVHGLGGQGFRSWITLDSGAGKSRSWLEDLLGNDVPNARIMTYGYISDGASYSYIVRNIVYGRALHLAKVLAAKRQQSKSNRRPLFFIAHSLGGWIVKRALIISSEAADLELKDIELSTCGVAFFGTLSPGRPLSPSPLANVIRRTTSNLGDHDMSRSRNMSSSQQPLATDIEWLEHQMEAFKAITANLPRLSFYETKKTQDDYVVEQRHSMTGSDGEQIALQATHSELVMFRGRDANYRIFIEKFRQMVDTSTTSGLLESKQKAFDFAAVHRLEYLSQGYAVPYRLPPEPHAVIARQDLLDRLDHLLSGSGGDAVIVRLGIVSLWGLPGTGKSTLARHYAELNRDKLSFVFWIRSESWETVAASYLEFANTIVDHYAKATPRAQVENDLGFAGVEDMLKVKSIMQLDSARVRSVVRSVKDWLLRPGNTRWLLVFDNVEPSYVLFDFIPLTVSGKIILTSRDSNCCAWGTKLQVDALEDEESISLLDAIVGGNTTRDPVQAEAASRVVQQLACHPQNIAVAAATIRHKGLSILEYQAMIESSIPTTLLGSTLHQSPLTKTVLQISAMLSASIIPVALFSATSSLKQAPERFRSIVGEMQTFQDPEHLDDVLHYLLDQNFIQTPSTPSDTTSSLVPSSPSSIPSSQSSTYFDSFVVDPKARDYVRGMLSDEEKLEHAWMACNVCVDGIKRKEAQSTTVQEIHDFGRIIGPHAKTCFEDWSGVLEASPDQDDVAWHILGQVCMTQGAIDQAIGCFRLSLSQQSNQMDVKDRIQTALSLSSLLQQTGQFQKSSEVLADIDMTSIDQALGFKVALARASATAAQGQFDCAEDQYEMLEFEQEEALGPLDIATVGTVQKLASTLEQMGKREEAQALYRRVYISYQNIYGPNDRMTLDALDDLANSYKESLAIDEAETLYKQSIDVRTRALGPDHPETAYAIQNLAVIDDLRRRYADAKTKYRQALDIIAPTLGRAHPLYTTTLENMAFSSRLHGQSIAATPLPQPTSSRSLSTSSRTKSVKMKEEALSREVTCRRAFEEAEKYYLDVLTIKKSARELYTEDQIVATGSKLAEMYENEKFFDDGRGVKMDMLRTMLRESRRRGTI